MSWLTDALDYAGGTLDKPGRAVRGLLGGRPDEFGNLIPFSDTLGITDPTRAVSGQDLVTQTFGSTGSGLGDSALGLGAELALDPTTYFGGALGRLGGRALGRGLEAAAAARGPGYGTKLEDLVKFAPVPGAEFLSSPMAVRETQIAAMSKPEQSLTRLLDANPSLTREIPPGSSILGNGVDAVALRTPAGNVLRLGEVAPGAAGRPVSDAVLQPTRTADYANEFGTFGRAERVPFVEGIGDRADAYWNHGAYPTMSEYSPRGVADYIGGSMPPYMQKTRLQYLTDEAASQGLHFWDNHLGNVGIHEGRPVIIDPGAFSVRSVPTAVPGTTPVVHGLPSAASTPARATDQLVVEIGSDGSLYARPTAAPEGLPVFAGGYNPVTTAGQPGLLTRGILDALGGRPAMRRALDRGLAAPTYQRDLGRGGLLAGALLGSTSGG
jgi:hypothetical protein